MDLTTLTSLLPELQISSWKVWTMDISLLFLYMYFVHLGVGGAEPTGIWRDECSPTSCGGDSGIVIRFPFWLKDRQPDFCGYPGFQLFCSGNNTVVFELQLPVKSRTNSLVFPVSVKVSVLDINYKFQVMKISALNASCLPKEFPSMNSSVFFPFGIAEDFTYAYTLFNCSSSYSRKPWDWGNEVTCLNSNGYGVLGFSSFYGISDLPLPSCTKMYDISNFPLEVFNGMDKYRSVETYVNWSRPSCAICEGEGRLCKLRSNDTRQEIQCFDIPKPQQPGMRKGVLKNLIVICGTIGILLLGVIVCLLILKIKKEDQKRIAMFLDDNKAFKLTVFSYADIKKITNKFKEKLGEGSYGRVYKGKLPNETTVSVKVLSNFRENVEEFIKEMRRIGRIHHSNVIHLVGYCADGKRRALVYDEFIPNDSLLKLVSSEDQHHSIGYKKWQEIAIGIAKGVDHIHQGCSQQILHLDINPNNILLDENYNPKITDIGLAKLSSKEQNEISLIASHGMTDYVAPELLSSDLHNASEKSDVFSFGMLLFDMVRRSRAGAGESRQIYFPEWMYSQLNMTMREEEACGQIDREGKDNIQRKLIIVGLWCTQWYPEDRPSMNAVIQMLEGENWPIMPTQPFW